MTHALLSIVNNSAGNVITLPTWAGAVLLGATLSALGAVLVYLFRFALIVERLKVRVDEHDRDIVQLQVDYLGDLRVHGKEQREQRFVERKLR